MSRSYKHSPVYTDGSCGSTKNTKRIANRIVRRHNKRITQGYFMRDQRYRDEITLNGKYYKKYFCSWNIHDWVNYWTEKDAIAQYIRWHDIYDEYRDINDFLNKHWKKYHYRK